MIRVSEEQALWVRGKVAEWLRVKLKHEPRGLNVGMLRQALEGRSAAETLLWRDIPGINQLDPDAWHSALLLRLLSGREPLDEPPPTEHSYPVYPDFEAWDR